MRYYSLVHYSHRRYNRRPLVIFFLVSKGPVMRELTELRDRLRQLSRGANLAWGVVSSGLGPLDALLPSRGFRRGTLVEWLAAEPGAGATLCALRAAREAMAGERPLVIVDHDGTFHPPGLGRLLSWREVLLVRCRTRQEALWVVDQTLRTSGVGAVLQWLDLNDERRLRRWQLAAEQSGALGLIVRRLSQQPEVCFSDARLLVTPLATAEGRRVRLELLRSRQGGPGAAVEVRLDDDTHALPAAADVFRRRAVGT